MISRNDNMRSGVHVKTAMCVLRSKRKKTASCCAKTRETTKPPSVHHPEIHVTSVERRACNETAQAVFPWWGAIWKWPVRTWSRPSAIGTSSQHPSARAPSRPLGHQPWPMAHAPYSSNSTFLLCFSLAFYKFISTLLLLLVALIFKSCPRALFLLLLLCELVIRSCRTVGTPLTTA
jgi:hypothetical protein